MSFIPGDFANERLPGAGMTTPQTKAGVHVPTRLGGLPFDFNSFLTCAGCCIANEIVPYYAI